MSYPNGKVQRNGERVYDAKLYRARRLEQIPVVPRPVSEGKCFCGAPAGEAHRYTETEIVARGFKR